MNTTIQAPLIASATEVPTRIALIDGEQEIAYFELASAVAGNATGLSERGVRPGDCVSILLDKSSVESHFGIRLPPSALFSPTFSRISGISGIVADLAGRDTGDSG